MGIFASTEQAAIKITDLVSDIHEYSGRLLTTTDNAISSLANKTTNAIDTLVGQAYIITATVGNTLTTGIVGIGFYLVIANDLNSRCSTFPIGCYALTIFGTFLIGAVSIATIHNFYRTSVALKNPLTQAIVAPVQNTFHTLNVNEGLNLVGTCRKCQDKKLVLSKGLGTFDITDLLNEVSCSCKTKVDHDDINDIVFKNCIFSYVGIDGNEIDRKQDPMRVAIELFNFRDWQSLEVTATQCQRN